MMRIIPTRCVLVVALLGLLASPVSGQDNCAFAPQICEDGGGALPGWVIYSLFIICSIFIFITKNPTRIIAVFGAIVFGFFSALSAGLFPPEYLELELFGLIVLSLLVWWGSDSLSGKDENQD